MNTRVMLVDDHPLLREGLRQSLERLAGVVVVGEFATGQAVLNAAARSAPDLFILDVHLPDMSGLEVARRLHDLLTAPKIIVLSADSNRALVDQALQIGVCGYVLKEAVPEELARAIRQVVEGRLYLCPELASFILGDYRQMLARAKPILAPPLTAREQRVLQLVAEGLQTKEIAAHLNVSSKSVEKSRARVMRKLGFHSVAELTRYAIREGLVRD